MLMGQSFISGNIIISPSEMRRRLQLLTCTSGSCNTRCINICQQSRFRQRQQRQLNCGRKTSGIGYTSRILNFGFVDFGKSVYKFSIVKIMFDMLLLCFILRYIPVFIIPFFRIKKQSGRKGRTDCLLSSFFSVICQLWSPLCRRDRFYAFLHP